MSKYSYIVDFIKKEIEKGNIKYGEKMNFLSL
jgi:DNA-binding GntR family transcriptional regulator